MICNLAGIVIFLSVYGIMASRPSAAKVPDCRMYVFAPMCRGVGAKRSEDVFDDLDILAEKRYIQSIINQQNRNRMGRWEEEEDRGGKSAKKPTEGTANPVMNYGDREGHRLLRWILEYGNRRIPSEDYNVPVQEWKTL